MAIKNKNLMMSLTESLNENKKQEIANFKKLKEATEDNVSYVKYLLDTAEDMDDVQQAIYQIDDTDLENEVQLMFDSCSEDDSLEEVISLVVSTMEDNAEYDEEMNESEIDDARKDSIEKGLISEDEVSDESNEDDRKNTLIAKKDELESRLGEILQSIKDKQMDTEEFRKLSREAADLDSQIMDLDNQIRGVYECDKMNEAELFNMDVYKDLADEDESVNIKELKMIQDYAVRKTKEIINYVYYNAPYSGIGDNILNDMLNVIKESLPDMNESINESDEDVCKGITDQLVSAGMTKEQAEQTAKGICNIFKNKVGSNQVVNEDVSANGDEVVTENITDVIPLLNAIEDELNEEKYRIDIDEDIKDKNYYYNYLDKILSNIESARNILNKYLETDNSVKENVNEDVSVESNGEVSADTMLDIPSLIDAIGATIGEARGELNSEDVKNKDELLNQLDVVQDANNNLSNAVSKYIEIVNHVESKNESAKPIKEAAITEKNLLKSQGNVYMFECKGNSDFSHIVGENYNEEENTLENVETYNNKEDADKDYLGRCEITTESQKPRDIEDGLDESIDNSEKVVNKFIDTLKKELPEYDWDYRFEGEQIVFYDKNEDFDFSNIDINYEKVDDIIKSIFGKDAYLDAQNSVIGVVSESVHNQVRNSLSESDDSYKVKSYHVENMGGGTMAIFGQFEDGRYFAGNEDGLNLYDIDVWPYHEKDTSEEEFQQLEKDHNIGSIDSIGNKFEYEKIISQTNF